MRERAAAAAAPAWRFHWPNGREAIIQAGAFATRMRFYARSISGLPKLTHTTPLETQAVAAKHAVLCKCPEATSRLEKAIFEAADTRAAPGSP